MKCVIVNTSDVSAGGAEMAGYAIFNSLNKYSEFDTRILCGTKNSHDDKASAIIREKRATFLKILHRVSEEMVFASVGQNYWHPSSRYLLRHSFIKNADIINLHNIHGNYFSYPVIRELNKIAPVVVTMQDMWYLTGHCAYTYDCNGHKTGCSRCPHLGWYPEIRTDTAAFHARKKQELFSDLDINFISCSNWLIREAENSFVLKGRKMHHIYNPIDTDVLFPIKNVEKMVIRNLFNVPVGKNVICFGAADIGDPRKGFLKLLSTFTEKKVREDNLFFVLMGNDPKDMVRRIPDYIPYIFLGNTKMEIRNFVYNLSDLLIVPSLADDLPNMLLESLASGLPVVSFDVGGSGEVIRSGYNGYLVKYGDFEEFTGGISELLSNKVNLQVLSENARDFALKNFTYQVCADNYAKLFRKILAERKG